MKISNKTRYGLQFMLNLAVNHGKIFINIKDIALKEDISVKFLENIVSIIKPGNLIEVKRGASGGYRLTKQPSDISMIEILELLEGDIFPVANQNKTTSPASEIVSVTNDFIEKLRENTILYLKSTSLADLVKDYQQRKDNFMFYI